MKKVFSCFGGVLLLASTTLAQDYAIKLDHPFKAGQRYNYTTAVQSLSQNTVTSQQQVVKNEKDDLAIELESVGTVVEVDSNGRPTKESHVIKKFVQGKTAPKKPVLEEGAKVVVFKKDKKTVFEVNGKPATTDEAKFLEIAIHINSGGASDDEIFGTTERKKVGASWDVNTAAATKDFADSPISKILSISKMGGKTTLQRVSKVEGKDVLHLSAGLTATMGPVAGGPFTTAAGTLQVSHGGAFPTDDKGTWEESGTMTLSIRASGKPDPNGPEIVVTGMMRRTGNSKMKILD